MNFVPSIVALSAMALVALGLTLGRGGLRAGPVALRGAVRCGILALAVQSVHFGEEITTGLQRSLPQVFGLDPVSTEAFATVNVVALVVWILSLVALARGTSAGLFPLWFLAVASSANALLHPALALASRDYFPGLVTSPLCGVAGVFLLRGLGRITSRDGAVEGLRPGR